MNRTKVLYFNLKIYVKFALVTSWPRPKVLPFRIQDLKGNDKPIQAFCGRSVPIVEADDAVLGHCLAQ